MNQATFTVIGCGDAFCCGGRRQTCFFLQAPSAGILIDCGDGALSGLKSRGISSDDIDFIVLTHFHGDHMASLPFIVFDAARQKRSKPLHIISPPGARERLEQLFSLYYPTSESALEGLHLDYHAFSGRDRVRCAPVLVESFPVKHTEASMPHGVRVSIDGMMVAYTGDTEWTAHIPQILDGADLGICDCTFYEKAGKNHLNYSTLREHLAELRCRRLLLTHFDDEMLRHLDDVGPDCTYEGLQILLR